MGGVGEAYPGSTGGEIFNCYEDSTAPVIGSVTRNQAAGYYSTASGVSNKASGDISWVAGFNNTVNDSSTPHNAYGHLVMGGNNTVSPGTGTNHSCTVGFYNTANGSDQVTVGYSNENRTSSSVVVGLECMATTGSNWMMYGGALKPYNNTPTGGKTIYGLLNNATTSITKPKVVVGVGNSNADRKNAIEMNYSDTKILTNFQLASDTTAVNAITPYIDPNNPTTDDKTLVTKSYRRNLPAQLTDDLVNNQSTSIAVGATLNLESGFSITFPAWTELIKIGITNSGGYMDYITMAADVNKNYASVTGAGTIDVYSYNVTTKDFTFVSGGSSASILSIRAEGKTTI